MRPRRTISVGVSVTTALFGFGLLLPTAASAGVGLFRYSHGQPLNDLRVTPGATFNVSVATICRSGYATSVRDVPESEKASVYAEYGITHHTTNEYEIDHLISLELGGSNAITNLWPELNDHPHGYLNSKDILENHLHELICAGKVSLKTAQNFIATNWVSAYSRFLGRWPNANAALSTTTTSSSNITTTGGSSPTAKPGGVKITDLVGSVAPGGHESLTAHSNKPGDSCSLGVTLPSGRQSTEGGLGETVANASGDATWSWEIGPTTGAGTAHVSVTCSAGVAIGSFIIS
jgi:hypothetical protein